MIPGQETFMKMLQNKEQVIKMILKDLDTSNLNKQGFEKLQDLLGQGKEVSTEKVLNACAKSLRHLNEVNTRLLLLVLV